MAFVPEGQADRSQARSAWSHEENSLVPAGRLKSSVAQASSLYLGRWFTVRIPAKYTRTGRDKQAGCLCYFAAATNLGLGAQMETTGLTMTSTVPLGRGLSASLPRHFVPGYYQLSLRDKSFPPGQM